MKSGFTIELLEAVAKQKGWTLDFVNVENVAAQLKAVTEGRVDAAATQINDLRRMIKYQGTGFEQRWSDGQYPFIMNWDNGLVYYPRAERVAPSMHRIDQALTNNVISSACSSVKIDWTWKNGTGYARYWVGASPFETAVWIRTDLEQPWFGMVDEQRGVLPYDTFDRWTGADTIFTGNPPNIEQYDSAIAPGKEPLVTYNALFGFNQDRPLVDNPDDANYGRPADYLAYTPWPSAIRVTLTLHDSKTTLEGGRELQFIIDLPRRATEFYQKR